MRVVVAVNPMVPIISAYRDIVLDGRMPSGTSFLYATLVAGGLAVSAWTAFRKLEGRFAERV